MYLLRALERAGALAGAISGGSRALDLLEQVASFSPDRRRWSLRYHSRSSPAGPLARRARSALGARRLRDLDADADGVLQIGAWYDVEGEGIRCSYHDGNLAVSLSRPEPGLDRHDRGVRRALEAERGLYDRLQLIFTDERLAAPLVRRRLRPGAGEGDHRRRRSQLSSPFRKLLNEPSRRPASCSSASAGSAKAVRSCSRHSAGYGKIGPTQSSGSWGPRSLRRRRPESASTAESRGARQRASAAWPSSIVTRRSSRCPRSTSRSGSPSWRRWPTGFPASGATAARCRRSSRTASPATSVDAFDTEALA